MKHLLISVIITAVSALVHPAFAGDACMDHLLSVHINSGKETTQTSDREMDAFRTLAEKALTLRAETIKVGQSIIRKTDEETPLSGVDINLINAGIKEHLALREELLKTAQLHECWLDNNATISGSLTPDDHLKGIMISLASALLLYDNYLLAISLFEGDGKLRRILNERDPGYAVNSAALYKVTLSYNSLSNRLRMRKALKFYESAADRIKAMLARNPEFEYVYLLINQSPSYAMLDQLSPLHVIAGKIDFLSDVTADSLHGLEREGVNLFSMAFGNTIGLVETRKGKLYQRQDVAADLRKNMISGDILLEKTPFRLTDKLIPGYWGHAAVWIGTETELKELGIWDHPVVKRYHEEIYNGRMVVEALRSGVEMNTLDHFLNIDSIGILRKPTQNREDRSGSIIQALRQVGKPYDFNFDVESKSRVYCSKLVYLSYGSLEWPTRKSLGRSTFTPDDVALQAAPNGKLELVTFYHDGYRVNDKPAVKMAELMGLGETDP